MRSTEGLVVRAFSTLAICALLVSGVAGSASAQATGAPPAKKAAAAATEIPHSATARCTDNTWSSAAKQQGACAKHGGVAKWIGKSPKGATARCKDGEFWTSPERQGACTGHEGVAYWLGKKPK